MKLAVFCSGNGSNLQAIIDSGIKVALVVCDNPRAYAMERAQKAGIETLLVLKNDYESKTDYETTILNKLKSSKIDFIALAGYMQLVGRTILRAYKNKILNIHPALLPSFKGMQGVKDALNCGVKVTGPTVHFVDEEIDHGPIVRQEAIVITEDDTIDSLTEKMHQAEHRIYPEAIKLAQEGRLKISGRKVKILGIALMLVFSFICLAPAEETELASLANSDYSYYDHWKLQCPIEEEEETVFTIKQKSIIRSEESQLLSDDERHNKKLDLYFQAATTTGELFDSIKMPYVTRGIESLLGWSKSLRSYASTLEDTMEDKYKLHFELDIDEPRLLFRHQY